YDMSNANFANTILGEAVQSAVNSLAEHLDANATTLPTHKVKLSGLVADVNGNTVILNIGTKAGVKVGDAFEVQRPTRTIKDPATGKVIMTIADKVGTLTVTDDDEQSATVTYICTGAEIVGVLSRGGMGNVFKVRNVISDRIDAMKVLLPNLAGRQELVQRFQREIKVLASLDHPNIAALRTALSWENRLVMIMEYVEGVT